MVIVREALASDARDILTFCQQIGSESDNLSYGQEGLGISVSDEEKLLTKVHEDERSYFLVAKEADELVGTCNYCGFRKARLAHRAEIGIAVKKDYWNQGIGRKLLTRLIALAKQSGLKVLSLEVRSDNSRAIHLYESLGFQKIGTFKHFMEINGKAVDFDIMELFLEKS
ncbi:Acetyltransferase (GNAT) family protein [Streptococcus equinus]|uniref:Acetyltransferase (GNAT) family protein n=1 Tax=Streptococcus equinus TaxID=1335 RepID=A0A1H0KHU6_STREI|nr:GNAT family N-acetyltransferase [Streptococcus equinus]SDO55497.1 Acetyltransferase (GNAT) family protein [Streptococcus equinus]